MMPRQNLRCVCCCGCIWHAPLRASQGQDYEARRSVASDRNRLDCRYVPKRKAWRIHALAEGGLSERAGRRALEIANDADLRLRFRKSFEAASSLFTVQGRTIN